MSPLALKVIEVIFETAIATGATQFTEEAIARGKALLGKVKARFQGKPQLQQTLQQAEEKQSREILEAEIVQPLAEEMASDRAFAEELDAIVREIADLKTQTPNQNQTQNQTQIGTNQQNQGNQPVFNVGQNQGGINLNLSQ